ncbi:WD40-repeat-containing domain [Pseudocohnilembus persalinus]|uniref:WD40-repeat-containing domain n=1 Tax=Pseudocohnilembus persalinus TaxID=266149 RepID=A0A0V0QDJ9_PSEPJ|nr:WD40-repeat-containing domain [Pseudocohnilembus persalinus]|eukprot:KRX00281.1 WD40-repeat-containing domain [Pseudocohnilembus persalinus]
MADAINDDIKIFGNPTVMKKIKNFIAIGTDQGMVIMYDIQSQFQTTVQLTKDKYKGRAGPVTSLDVSFDFKIIAIGYQNGFIDLIQLDNQYKFDTYKDLHTSSICQLKFIHENTNSLEYFELISADINGQIHRLQIQVYQAKIVHQLPSIPFIDKNQIPLISWGEGGLFNQSDSYILLLVGWGNYLFLQSQIQYILKIAKQHKLFRVIAYISTKYKKDFLTPLNYIKDEFLTQHKQVQNQKNLEKEAWNRIMWYINMCFKCIIINGDKMRYNEQIQMISDIINFLKIQENLDKLIQLNPEISLNHLLYQLFDGELAEIIFENSNILYEQIFKIQECNQGQLNNTFSTGYQQNSNQDSKIQSTHQKDEHSNSSLKNIDNNFSNLKNNSQIQDLKQNGNYSTDQILPSQDWHTNENQIQNIKIKEKDIINQYLQSNQSFIHQLLINIFQNYYKQLKNENENLNQNLQNQFLHFFARIYNLRIFQLDKDLQQELFTHYIKSQIEFDYLLENYINNKQQSQIYTQNPTDISQFDLVNLLIQNDEEQQRLKKQQSFFRSDSQLSMSSSTSNLSDKYKKKQKTKVEVLPCLIGYLQLIRKPKKNVSRQPTQEKKQENIQYNNNKDDNQKNIQTLDPQQNNQSYNILEKSTLELSKIIQNGSENNEKNSQQQIKDHVQNIKAQQKNQDFSQSVFTWLNYIFAKHEQKEYPYIKLLKNTIIQNFDIFLKISEIQSIELFDSQLKNFGLEILEKLKGQVETQLTFMKHVIAQPKSQILKDIDVVKIKYIDLLAQQNPKEVIKEIKNMRNFPMDKILEICQNKNIKKAEAYIYQRQGNYRQALQIFSKIFIDYLQTSTRMFQQKNISFNKEKIRKKLDYNLELCLEFQQQEEDETKDTLWFEFCDKVIKYITIKNLTSKTINSGIQEILCFIVSQIFETMCTNLEMNYVIEKFTSKYGSIPLKVFKNTNNSVKSLFEFINNTHKSTQKDIAQTIGKLNIDIKNKQGQKFDLIQDLNEQECFICKKSFQHIDKSKIDKNSYKPEQNSKKNAKRVLHMQIF